MNTLAHTTDIYGIEKTDWGAFIKLSDEETTGRFFDSAKLARTLNISEDDAKLLRSGGKTYVFAKTADGNIIQLYHADLSINYLHISVQQKTEEQFKQFVEEWGDKWEKYSSLIGQTSNPGHFVC